MAAAASDKARFYLEQAVPELQDYKEKGIFTSAEISAIAAKRSAFEHRINMAGASSPSDYARYTSYEINLDQLRRKRCKRLGVKGTRFVGQRRIMSVLDRGTKKFPGDLSLWMQYLEFLRREGSNAKLNRAVTKVLRLHPVKWELWVWTARYFFEDQGDVSTARSYMQRGLRFCPKQRDMWLQYLKLEMIYLAKVAARRRILKLDQDPDSHEEGDLNGQSDEVALPAVTETELDPETSERLVAIDEATLEQIANAPIFEGAIAVAIIDGAFMTFKQDPVLAHSLFDVVYDFVDVPSSQTILAHISTLLSDQDAHRRYVGPVYALLSAKLRLFNVDVTSPNFPPALHEAIKSLRPSAGFSIDESQWISQSAVLTLAPLLDTELDEDIRAVVLLFLRRHLNAIREKRSSKSKTGNAMMDDVQAALRTKGVSPAVMAEIGISEPLLELEHG